MAESIVVAFPLSVPLNSPHIPCEDSPIIVIVRHQLTA